MTFDRDRFLLFEAYNWSCAWCGRQVDELQIHHLVHKGMGGRHGEARVASEQQSNRVPLCVCCHSASHGERATDSNGFNCSYCDRECQYRQYPPRG